MSVVTIQAINVGALPNDGTGDTVRAALTKSNTNFAALAAGVTATGTFLPAGTGGQARTVQDKLSEFVSALDYMTTAQKTNVLLGIGNIDVSAAVQAAANDSIKVRMPAGAYLLNAAQIALTCQHQLTGDGLNTLVSSTLAVPVFHFAAPVSDSVAALYLGNMTINAKAAWCIGGTSTSSFNTDGAIIGGTVECISVNGTYGAGAGDALYNTANVRDTSNNSVSIASGTNLSAANTIADIAAYGVGGRQQKCLRMTIRDVNMYGVGVGYAFEGCDHCRLDGGRIHEVGLFGYSNRQGSYGSQTHWTPRELLHNRRAGGIIMISTKFDRVENFYYECYSNSACMLWRDATEGTLVAFGRVDDPYYTGGGGSASGTTPLILDNNVYINNRIRNCRFQKFSPWTTPAPSIRAIGIGSQDSNHVELGSIEDCGPFFATYSAYTPGFRTGPIDKSRFDGTNCGYNVAGNFGPLWQVLSGEYVCYNASTSIFPAVRLDCIGAGKIGYSLEIRLLSIGGTTVFFTIYHVRADGSTSETLLSASISGFSASSFQTVTQALAFNQEPRPGDYIVVTWGVSSAQLKSLRIY